MALPIKTNWWWGLWAENELQGACALHMASTRGGIYGAKDGVAQRLGPALSLGGFLLC